MSYDLKTAESPAYAPFFGYMGAASAQIFTVLGAAYGTAKSAVGISSMGVMRPELIMKSVIPVIMAGIIGIYGLVVAMVLKGKVKIFFVPLFSRCKPLPMATTSTKPLPISPPASRAVSVVLAPDTPLELSETQVSVERPSNLVSSSA